MLHKKVLSQKLEDRYDKLVQSDASVVKVSDLEETCNDWVPRGINEPLGVHYKEHTGAIHKEKAHIQ